MKNMNALEVVSALEIPTAEITESLSHFAITGALRDAIKILTKLQEQNAPDPVIRIQRKVVEKAESQPLSAILHQMYTLAFSRRLETVIPSFQVSSATAVLKNEAVQTVLEEEVPPIFREETHTRFTKEVGNVLWVTFLMSPLGERWHNFSIRGSRKAGGKMQNVYKWIQRKLGIKEDKQA